MQTTPPPTPRTHEQPSSSSSSSSSSSTHEEPPLAATSKPETKADQRETERGRQAGSNPKPETAPKAGRPSLLTSHLLDLLTQIISQTGRSDSAAAEFAGLSTSTISRWKQDYPELTIELLRAREHFRARQLNIINEASHQRGGWRAAAWLLERIFPEDYSPRASEREKFIRLAEARQVQEEEALARADDFSEPHEASSSSSPSEPPRQRPPGPTSAAAVIPSVPDSQNSQNPPTVSLRHTYRTPFPKFPKLPSTFPRPRSPITRQSSPAPSIPSIASSREATTVQGAASVPAPTIHSAPEAHHHSGQAARSFLIVIVIVILLLIWQSPVG